MLSSASSRAMQIIQGADLHRVVQAEKEKAAEQLQGDQGEDLDDDLDPDTQARRGLETDDRASFRATFSARTASSDLEQPPAGYLQLGESEENEVIVQRGSKMWLLSLMALLTDSERFQSTKRLKFGMQLFAVEGGDGKMRKIESLRMFRRTIEELVEEQRREGEIKLIFKAAHKRGPRCLIKLNSNFGETWDILQMLFLLYVALLVPLRTGFDRPVAFGTAAWWCDLVVDVYFICDIFVNFRRAYLNLEEDKVVEDLRSIRQRYLRSWYRTPLA